jgi:hypothetical protein
VPYLDPGVNCAGRSIYKILTEDQFAERLSDAIATERIALSSLGEKWPVDNSGRARYEKVIGSVFRSMTSAGHFREDPDTLILAEAISTEDTTLGRIRARVLGFFQVDGRVFTADIFLRSSALTE